MNNYLKRLDDCEQAQFVSIEGNILTVDTEDSEYQFKLTDPQLEQCYQQLANKDDATFTININKGIIIFNTELSIQEQANIDSISDYYLALENKKITKIKCEIENIYLQNNSYYAEINTELGEKKIVYLSKDHFNIIYDVLMEHKESNSVDEVYFSYSPELEKILLNDLEEFDEGDLELGNQFNN